MYDRYRELRDLRGLKDSWVAETLKITRSTFSDWKNGKSSPCAETLVKIAGYFNTTVEYLMTGKENEGGEAVRLDREDAALLWAIQNNDELRKLVEAEKGIGDEGLKALYSVAKAMGTEK